MIVKDLIEELKKHDPNKSVYTQESPEKDAGVIMSIETAKEKELFYDKDALDYPEDECVVLCVM